MGVKHLEGIPIQHKNKVTRLGELSRKDHIRLEAVLLEENQKLKITVQLLSAANTKLKNQSKFFKKIYNEKVP